MKKIVSILLAILSTCLLVSCGGNMNTIQRGAYWNEDPTVQSVENIDETLKYSVSFVDSTKSGNKYSTTSNLKFELDSKNSSYEVTLKNKDGNYEFTSVLTVSGKYIFGENEYSFENDTVTSVCVFKGLQDGLKPISSTVTKVTHTPLINVASSEDFVYYNYTTQINYENKNAKIKVTNNDVNASQKNESEKTVKDYNKTYVDNSIMLFYFRSFDYKEALSYSFNTIDLSTKNIQKLTATTVSTDGKYQQVALPNYSVNGGKGDEDAQNKKAYGINMKTGTGDLVYEAYYAVNDSQDNDVSKNLDRHRVLEFYSPAIYKIGFFKFTLSTVNTL